MPKENNKMQVDIDTLKKQNVNDLLSIKELYSKLEELEEKITQTKYIDNTIVKKLKKEYEKLENIILDENVQIQLSNDIKTINSQMDTKANKSDIKTINSQLDTKTNEILKNKHLTNVLSLGVKNEGSKDCTEIIHNALANGESLYFPKGTYLLKYLKLNARNIIVGESESNTYLQPNTTTEESFISIVKGAVNNIRLENFKIKNTPNKGQVGIDITAKLDDAGLHGGLWDSTIKNIYLTDGNNAWKGIGMRLIGSGSNSNLPIQLNIFEKVNIWVNNLASIDYIPLLVEGQVEQNLFNRCTFSGVDTSCSLTDLENASAIFRRKRVNGAIDGDNGGGSNSFVQCYFGNCPRSLRFERSLNPTFINCYYENMRELLRISAIGKATIVGGTYTPHNTSKAENWITSDYSANELILDSISLKATVNCRGLNTKCSGIINKSFDEITIKSNNISFGDLYANVHLNFSTYPATINTISPSNSMRYYNEYILNFLKTDKATINFSKDNGNIYNNLSIDCSSNNVRVKLSLLPYLNKYKVEIL